MRVLVLGSGGFIGRHIVGDLLDAGHEVFGTARSIQSLSLEFPKATFIAINLAHAFHISDWESILDGMDVIVNAAGVLRGSEMATVHVAMPQALHKAAEAASVQRVILISAISARDNVATDYASSKLAGEAQLRSTKLDWIIFRPSLVYGDGSYGGTSLMRGMAGLPFFVPIPGQGDFAFTPIHVADLAQAVRIAVDGEIASRQTLEAVGPETLTLKELLARYRAWLGFGRARFVNFPLPVMRLLGKIGDVLSDGPISTNSLDQLIAGNAGDSASFAKSIGFSPRSIGKAQQARPAQVQDRWHARLFFLAPLLNATLVIMWLASAWLGFVYGEAQTAAVIHGLGLQESLANPLRIGSCMMDIAIAALLLFGRSIVQTTILQLLVIAGYTLVIGFALPHLWLDPLAPLLKNLPIIVVVAIYGVIGEKR